MEPAIETVVVVASADGGTFGQVPGLYIRVLDERAGTEVARYDSADAGVETAFVLGEFYRRQGKLVSVDGMAPIPQVATSIRAVLDEIRGEEIRKTRN